MRRPEALVLVELLKQGEAHRKPCDPEEHIVLEVSLKHEDEEMGLEQFGDNFKVLNGTTEHVEKGIT